jgi:proteasome lid subunit RPN8/RPN11
MPKIEVASRLIRELYAHAREVFPVECCGYLRGDVAEARTIVRCTNALSRPRAERGYELGDRELFEFAKAFTAAAAEDRPVIVYHSHTNGRAYFSSTDRAFALGGDAPAYPVQHIVIGVTAEGITEAAQYAWSEEMREFVEVARWDAEC